MFFKTVDIGTDRYLSAQKLEASIATKTQLTGYLEICELIVGRGRQLASGSGRFVGRSVPGTPSASTGRPRARPDSPDAHDRPVEGLEADEAKGGKGADEGHAERALEEEERVGRAEVEGGERGLVEERLRGVGVEEGGVDGLGF